MSFVVRQHLLRSLPRRPVLTATTRPLSRPRTSLEAFCLGRGRPLGGVTTPSACLNVCLRRYGHLAGGDKDKVQPAKEQDRRERAGTAEPQSRTKEQIPTASANASASASRDAKDAVKTAAELGAEKDLSTTEQRQKDWAIIKRLMVNIWPPGDWGTKGRVLLGFGLLVSGKVSIEEA